MSDSVSEYGMGAPNTQDPEAVTPEVNSDHPAGRRAVGDGIAEAEGMSDTVNEYGMGAPNTQINPTEVPGFEPDDSNGRVVMHRPVHEEDLVDEEDLARGGRGARFDVGPVG